MQRNVWSAALVAAVAGCAAIGSGEGASSGALFEPDWVDRGDALVVDGDSRYFVAVAQARDRLRLPLLTKAAEKKALNAIDRPIRRYLKVLAGPWLASLDPKIMRQKPKPAPIVMLDKLLERCAKLAAVDEVHVSGGKAVWAMSRVDLTPIVLEMQASSDVQPLVAFLTGSNIDPAVVFDRVASGELGGEPPAEEAPAPTEPPAEQAEQAESGG
jgi:hypothetical protein